MKCSSWNHTLYLYCLLNNLTCGFLPFLKDMIHAVSPSSNLNLISFSRPVPAVSRTKRECMSNIKINAKHQSTSRSSLSHFSPTKKSGTT